MGFYTDLVVPLTRSVMDRLCSDELPYTACNNACMDKMNCCKNLCFEKRNVVSVAAQYLFYLVRLFVLIRQLMRLHVKL